MPNNVYECMFILDPAKVGGDMAVADKHVRTILEKHKAEVLVSRPWDERRLAFPIKNQKKGLYYLTYFSSEGKDVLGIEQDCALSEMILRMMILWIDPKMVETMLAVAKGEHATALHSIKEDEPTEGAPVIEDDLGGDKGHSHRGGPREKRGPRE